MKNRPYHRIGSLIMPYPGGHEVTVRIHETDDGAYWASWDPPFSGMSHGRLGVARPDFSTFEECVSDAISWVEASRIPT